MSTIAVDICNSALIKLGAEPISDLTDNTKEAKLCRYQYEKVRNAVLRSAPWSFAVTRALLTPTVVTLEFGDENVFQLPADCVRVCKVNDGDATYKIEGRYLLTDDDEVEMYYVSKDATPSSYDAAFCEAVAATLAADIAYALTQSQAMMNGLLQLADFYINQARSMNSQEQTPESFKFDTFIDARTAGNCDALYD
jgi:hypothetical protein